MGLLAYAIHPGRILREEYMEPLGLSAGSLARRLGVPRSRIEALSRGERAVTADTAFRLARCFRTTPEFWLNMQRSYDLAQLDEAAYAGIEPVVA